MRMHNAEIADVFDQIADMLEIEGQNPFRIRAYHTAARTLRDVGTDVNAMLDHGDDLSELPGIGKDLANQIAHIAREGTSETLVELEKELPPAICALLKVPGLGPKRVKILHDRLGVGSLDELATAVREGRLKKIRGFGPVTLEKILAACAQPTAVVPTRFKLSAATEHADALVAWLSAGKHVEHVTVAGSFRRAKETVGDLDVLVSAHHGNDAIERFVHFDEVTKIEAQGPTRASVVLRSGLHVDVRVVGPECYGAALHYFTGSKPHNIAIRRLGQRRGLKISEYGVFKGKRRVAGEDEPSVFASVGLPYIPPELRENRGEIEAAREGRLPQLVEVSDVLGDLHVHTKATDGRNTLEEMVEAARAQGLKYIAVTDHSPRLAMTKGLDAKRLHAQRNAIEKLNAKYRDFTVLAGIEVDILEDGRLDLPDEVLSELDVVVAAMHGAFDLPRGKQTTRLMRAMDNRYVTILAHPSARLIDERPPCELDMARVIRGARESGCALEINAHPERLDLDDVSCQMAHEAGVKLAIDTDAHSVLEFAHLRFGVGQARRGWVTKDDVINTRTVAELRKLIAR